MIESLNDDSDNSDNEEIINLDERIENEINNKTDTKYNPIVWKVYEYEGLDTMWKCCKESLFLRSILKARLEWNEDTFADHCYWWNNAYPLRELDIMLLKTMKNEISYELDRRHLKYLRDEKERKRIEKRKIRFEKKKQSMANIGVDIVEDDVADELDKEEELDELDGENNPKNNPKNRVGDGMNDDDDDEKDKEDRPLTSTSSKGERPLTSTSSNIGGSSSKKRNEKMKSR